MKAIALDKLTPALRRFSQHKAPDAEEACKLLADVFDLYLACIFSETKDGNMINFSRVGFYSKNKVKIPDQIPLVELSSQCQEFWNSSVQTAAIHSSEHRESIEKLSDRIGVPGIKQFGLLKFYWSSDKKRHLLIAGVVTECKPTDVEPFFTLHNLTALSCFANILTPYITLRNEEYFERARNNFYQSSASKSRSSLFIAALELLKVFQKEIPRDEQDYVWSTYLDMKTALDILPGQEIWDKRDASFENKKPDDCLTSLAELRKKRWEQNKDVEFISDYSQTIHKIYVQKERSKPGTWDIKRFLDLPQNPLLPEQLVKQCQQFVSEKWLDIELIRTQFFCLHHTASRIHPAWGRSSVKKLQNILFEKILGKNLIARAQELVDDFLILWQKENEPLIITSDWLAAWFGSRVLKSRLLKKKTQDNIYSPNELAQICKHLGCYFLYIFHWLRNAGNATAFKFSDVEGGYEDVIESTLYLISEYAHVDLELRRSAKLYDALMDMWASEAVLYTVHDTYREHLHHTVDVCLMGFLLIESGLLKEISKSSPRNIKDLRNWVLAALLHDVGYGLNLNRLILDHLRFLEHSPLLKHYLKNLKNALDSQEDDLCRKIQIWMPGHQIKKIDHGVISAMFTCHLHLNRASPDSIDKAWLDDIQPTLRAIIRHNLPKDRIDPKKEPLSFLLFLCDHLQEWDRPRVDKRFRYFLSANLLRTPGSPPSTTTLIRHLKTNLYWNRKDKKWDLPDNDLRFELIFKDAYKESFEPAIIWCFESFDLQKIRQKQLPRNIFLAFVHPLSEELKTIRAEGELTELDFLQDFVREEGMKIEEGVEIEKEMVAAFSVWLDSIRKKRYGLSHEYNSTTKEEWFTFTLKSGRKSEETSLVPFLPSKLYEKFLSWKKERLQIIKQR
jgi:hypothetical protein